MSTEAYWSVARDLLANRTALLQNHIFRTICVAKWSGQMNMIDGKIEDAVFKRLYSVYVERTTCWIQQQRHFERRQGVLKMELPLPEVLNFEAFQDWLKADWRTPVLKRQWLETFLDLSPAALKCWDSEVRKLLYAVLEKLPTRATA